MRTRKLAAKDVVFTVAIEQDDMPVRGNAMASGDDAADREVEDAILASLERGDIEAWCTIVVKAHWQGFSGIDTLGGSSFLGPIEVEGEMWSVERQVNESITAHDMRGQALADLNGLIAATASKLATLKPRAKRAAAR